MKIALFTCFSPAGGGGATNLRSWLAHLSGIEVIWCHLGPPLSNSPQYVSVGRHLVGGPLVPDLVQTPLLWCGWRAQAVRAIASRIVALQAHCHWVVAMDEGIVVGNMLRQMAPRTPLHVSIQDDQEFGMYARSRRYRALARLTRRPIAKLLRSARSVDVTSDAMQRYYADRLGLQSTVLHPVVDPSGFCASTSRSFHGNDKLTMGHIGAIYSSRELVTMLSALRSAAVAARRTPAAVFIGLLPRYRIWLQRFEIAATVVDWLPEREAVRLLANCDFVYAMYPFDSASGVFCRTSLPTKLTTYVQARRPILVHAPAESTLAHAVQEFNVGVVCDRNSATALAQSIALIFSREPDLAAFENFRERYYGLHNADKLARLLTAGSA